MEVTMVWKDALDVKVLKVCFSPTEFLFLWIVIFDILKLYLDLDKGFLWEGSLTENGS